MQTQRWTASRNIRHPRSRRRQRSGSSRGRCSASISAVVTRSGRPSRTSCGICWLCASRGRFQKQASRARTPCTRPHIHFLVARHLCDVGLSTKILADGQQVYEPILVVLAVRLHCPKSHVYHGTCTLSTLRCRFGRTGAARAAKKHPADEKKISN